MLEVTKLQKSFQNLRPTSFIQGVDAFTMYFNYQLHGFVIQPELPALVGSTQEGNLCKVITHHKHQLQHIEKTQTID